MWEDPIVAEVRRARKEIELECHGSFEEISARAVKVQEDMKDRLAKRKLIQLPEALRAPLLPAA